MRSLFGRGASGLGRPELIAELLLLAPEELEVAHDGGVLPGIGGIGFGKGLGGHMSLAASHHHQIVAPTDREVGMNEPKHLEALPPVRSDPPLRE